MKKLFVGTFAIIAVIMLAACQQEQPKPNDADEGKVARNTDSGVQSSAPTSGTRAIITPWQWTVYRNGNTVTQGTTTETADEFDIADGKTISVVRPSTNGTLCTIVQMADEASNLDRIILDNGTSLTKVKSQDTSTPPKLFYYAELGQGKYYFLSHRVAKRVGVSAMLVGKNYRVRKKSIGVYASGTIYSISCDSNDNVDIRVHQGSVEVVNFDIDPEHKKLVILQDQRAIIGQKTDPSFAIAVPDN